MIEREFIRRMRAKYGDPRGPGDNRFATLRPGKDGSAADLVERFLADASVRLAILHSRRLGQDFVLARDEKALESLTEADHALPVLFFADCGKHAGLDATDLSKIFEVRQTFGPSVSLSVEARLG